MGLYLPRTIIEIKNKQYELHTDYQWNICKNCDLYSSKQCPDEFKKYCDNFEFTKGRNIIFKEIKNETD